MTVGTNALLERGGARTALVATAGFTDLLEIARQDRPSLYRPCEDRPAPLCPPDLRVGVRERIGPDGPVEALTGTEIDRVVAEVRRLDPESVAICLLFSHLDPTHEEALASAVREALPGLHVSASAEVLPQFREYERCATTVLDAYLSPLLARYLRRLPDECGALGIPVPMVMQSSGGVVDAERAAGGGAWSVLSGPAGGAVGAGLLATAERRRQRARTRHGGHLLRRLRDREWQRPPDRLPRVRRRGRSSCRCSTSTRSARAAARSPGETAVAPCGSARARRAPGPGPPVTAAAAKSRRSPTPTCCSATSGGGPGRRGHARPRSGAAAVATLADALDLEPDEAARGIVEVANEEMVRAMRVVTVERGVDPRGFALLPFGGAGPLHAAAIAAELGIGRILCPRSGGVLSALGLIASERRRDTARTVMLAGARADPGADRARRSEALARGPESAATATGSTPSTSSATRASPSSCRSPAPWSPSRRSSRRRSRPSTSAATATASPGAPSSWSTCGSPLTPRSPSVELPRADGAGAESGTRRASFGGEWLRDRGVARSAGGRCGGRGTLRLRAARDDAGPPAGWAATVDEVGTIVAVSEGR